MTAAETYADLVAILTRLRIEHGLKAFSLPEYQAAAKAIEKLKNENWKGHKPN